jgi:hypothetical protein
VNPGSGQNNYSLTWNNANSRWEASNNIAGVTVRKGVGANTQAIGSTANGSGVNWIAQSENAGISNSLGNNWVAIGANSGISNSLGSDWQAIGINAGLLNSQGNYWVALGGGAAQNNTVGTAFFSLGVFSGFNNSTGSQFVNIGYDSGFFDDRSFYLNIANTRSKSLICGDFAILFTLATLAVRLLAYTLALQPVMVMQLLLALPFQFLPPLSTLRLATPLGPL